MGLDTVEWVMGFEGHLGERLPDEVAFRLRTLGDAIDLLEARFGHQRGFCATQRTYHLLSRAHGARRLALDAAVGRAPLRVGDLEVPTELSLGGTLGVTAAVLTGIAGGLTLGGVAGLAAGTAGVATAAAIAGLSERPRGASVRELVRATTCRNYGALLRSGAAWRRELAREAVFALSADQGARPEELTEATRVCDLFPDG